MLHANFGAYNVCNRKSDSRAVTVVTYSFLVKSPLVSVFKKFERYYVDLFFNIEQYIGSVPCFCSLPLSHLII